MPSPCWLTVRGGGRPATCHRRPARVVLFYWASSQGLAAYDRLGGRFNKVEPSKVRVKVEPKEMNLEPFRLDIAAKLIRPAEKAPTLPQ